MSYEIIIDKPALKFIAKQPFAVRERIFGSIKQLPNNGDIKALQGHIGYFRLRVGDVRVIYTFEHEKLVVRVVNVGNRGDIYK